MKQINHKNTSNSSYNSANKATFFGIRLGRLKYEILQGA
jgi:hypothetical protein